MLIVQLVFLSMTTSTLDVLLLLFHIDGVSASCELRWVVHSCCNSPSTDQWRTSIQPHPSPTSSSLSLYLSTQSTQHHHVPPKHALATQTPPPPASRTLRTNLHSRLHMHMHRHPRPLHLQRPPPLPRRRPHLTTSSPTFHRTLLPPTPRRWTLPRSEAWTWELWITWVF